MNLAGRRFGAFFWFTLVLSLAGWSAVAYRSSAAVCLRQALDDLDAERLEALHYDLPRLSGKAQLEPYTQLVRGKLLLTNGFYDEAAIVLSLAATHSATRRRATVLYGEALYSLGRFLEAGKVWTAALETNARDTDALRWLGVAYYDLGAYQEATRYLEQAASLAADDPRPHHLIGISWQFIGDWQRAATALEESLRRDPSRLEADDVRLRLADCDARLAKNKEALHLLDQCPTSAGALTVRARCEQNLGDIAGARRSLRRALQRDPENSTALSHLGELEIQAGNLNAAVKTLEELARLSPALTEAHLKLASVYFKLGRRAEAEREKQAVEDLRPLVKRYAELREVAFVDPTDARVRLELGELAKHLRRMDEAKTWFRAAIYLDPENQAAQEALLPLLSAAPAAIAVPE